MRAWAEEDVDVVVVGAGLAGLVAALAGELGVERFPTFGDGEHLIELDGELRRFTGSLPKLPPHALADFAQAAFRLDRMARQVPVAAPWEARKAERWDGQTFPSSCTSTPPEASSA